MQTRCAFQLMRVGGSCKQATFGYCQEISGGCHGLPKACLQTIGSGMLRSQLVRSELVFDIRMNPVI